MNASRLARPTRRAIGAVAGTVALSAAVVGCGSSPSRPVASAAPAPPVPSAGTAPRGGPAAAGLIAEITGNTLQVQSDTTQTAVTYQPATVITAIRPADISALAVGQCAVVREAGAATPAAATPATTLTAATVALSDPVDGQCPGRFGGRATGRPGGAPGAGRGTGGPGRGAGAVGRVSAVTGTSFTLSTLRRPVAASPSATPTPAEVTVTTTPATTFTRAAPATAAALATGLCVTVAGTLDTTGAVAATSIAVRPPDGGSCSSGRAPGVAGG